MDGPAIARVILYVNVRKVAAFYERFFGLRALPGASDGWTELASPAGGCTIALHKAAATQKSGAAMKIVFGVADVRKFKRQKESQGLRWSVVHQPAEGFEFCNAKDPAGNSISISSRGMNGK